MTDDLVAFLRERYDDEEAEAAVAELLSRA